MNNKKKITFLILFVGLLIIGTTYAYYSFTATNNKNISFNTSKELQNYVIYNEGESKFSGDFKVSSTYTEGMHSTISLYKTSEAANVDLIATIKMDINEIGNNIKNSKALKWVVTSGTSTNVGNILSQGNFIGVNNNDTLTLVPNLEVTSTETFYTIWLWLDSNESPEDSLTGETLDVNVWTEINQVEGIEESFTITRINANYQNINATIVNNKNKITSYAVTTSNTEPNEWTSIETNNQSNVYNLDYSVLETGTYYVWIKDSEGNTISRSIEVTQIDTTGPVCTWGSFSKSKILEDEDANIELTCIDTESGVVSSNINNNEIIINGTGIIIDDILKEEISNGYKYLIRIIGTNNIGNNNLTLNGKIKNAVGLFNSSVSSSNIETYIDVTPPTGSISLSNNNDNLLITLNNLVDTGSGIKNTYGYSISTNSTCDSTVSFDSSSSTEYSYTIDGINTYYICVKLIDNAGNSNYLSSASAYQILNNNDEIIGYENNLNDAFSTVLTGGKIKTIYNNSTTGGVNSKNIVLDTNGKSITLIDDSMITNNVTMTITGAGSILSSNSTSGCSLLATTGNLTINNVTLNAGSCKAIDVSSSQSILNVLDGNIVSSDISINQTNGTVTVSGGTITSTGNSTTMATVLLSGGEFNLSGGIINGASKTSIIFVNGGEFNLSGGELGATDTPSGISIRSGEVNVTDGNYTWSRQSPFITVLGTNAELNISGGTISSDYFVIANGLGLSTITGGTMTSSNNVIIITGGVLNMSGGTINGTSTTYAAVLQGGGEFNLSGGMINGSTSNVVALNVNKGEFNLSGSGIIKANSTSAVAVSVSGGEVNLIGGTISATNSTNAVYLTGGIVNIDGGTYNWPHSNPFAVVDNTNAVVNMISGSISADSNIFVIKNGNVYMTGGTVTGNSSNSNPISISDGIFNLSGGVIDSTQDVNAIGLNSGECYITSGNYTWDKTLAFVYVNAGKLEVTGGTITSDAQVFYQGNGTVNITNGTFTSGTSSALYLKVNGTTNVSGGSFNGRSSTMVMFALAGGDFNLTGGTFNSTAVTNAFSVSAGNLNIKSGTYTWDVASAFIYISAGTLNLTGGTINVTASAAVYMSSSTGIVAMSGGTLNGATNSSVVRQYGGTFNLSSGTITGNSSSVVVMESGGTLNMTGGAITSSVNTNAFGLYSGTTNISTGTYNWNQSGAFVYANGGDFNMSNGTITCSSMVYRLLSGTTSFTGGTLISNSSNVFNMSGGTLNMGTNDTTITTDYPRAVSKTTSNFAIYFSGGTWNWYDGVIYGGSQAILYYGTPSTTYTVNKVVDSTYISGGYKAYLS